MSEEKIHELHRRLSEKFIEEAHAFKDKLETSVSVRLSQEIVDIRREIHRELQKLKGVAAHGDEFDDVE
jgi:Ni,Fe-hydrogenase III component G